MFEKNVWKWNIGLKWVNERKTASKTKLCVGIIDNATFKLIREIKFHLLISYKHEYRYLKHKKVNLSEVIRKQLSKWTAENRIAVLQRFTKFTWKYLTCSAFFSKVAGIIWNLCALLLEEQEAPFSFSCANKLFEIVQLPFSWLYRSELWHNEDNWA